MRVDAYRNLNKPGVQFSIRVNGRVAEYREIVFLQDCTFKHATCKQLDAVRTGARQVCQWVKGTLVDDVPAELTSKWRRLSCDPKTSDGFCDAQTGERIDRADAVLLASNGAFYCVE